MTSAGTAEARTAALGPGVDEAPTWSPDATERQFSVIEGRLDLAARALRVLGTTFLVTLVVALIGALVLQAMLIEGQGELDQRHRDLVELRAQTDELHHELARLEAPSRIVAEARRMGMVEVGRVTYLQAENMPLEDRTVNVATSQLRGG